jgi:hypothetical protein
MLSGRIYSLYPRQTGPGGQGPRGLKVAPQFGDGLYGAHSGVEHIHEAAFHRWIVSECTGHMPGDHSDTRFIDPTGCHALMLGLDDDRDTSRCERLFDTSADLCGHGFLCLETACISINDPCQLANAHHPVFGQISDLGGSDNRHHVMFAMRLKGDVPQEHYIVIAMNLFEGSCEQCRGIDSIPAEELCIGICYPRRRITQSLSLGVIPCPD